MKAKIKPGYRINNITVLEDTGKKVVKSNANRKIWRCQCDCGKIFEQPANRLMGKAARKSCGCTYSFDLIGKKFGSLTVIAKSEKKTKHGKKNWICRCDCGNEVEVTSSKLKGKNVSCGCLDSHNKEKIHLPVGIDGIYYGNNNPYTLKFEDGYSMKVKYRGDGSKITHPVLKQSNRGCPFDYFGFKILKIAFKMTNEIYYYVTRPDGESDCMTPREMLYYNQR